MTTIEVDICKRHKWAPLNTKELSYKKDKNTGAYYDPTWYYDYYCVKCHIGKKVKGERE